MGTHLPVSIYDAVLSSEDVTSFSLWRDAVVICLQYPLIGNWFAIICVNLQSNWFDAVAGKFSFACEEHTVVTNNEFSLFIFDCVQGIQSLLLIWEVRWEMLLGRPIHQLFLLLLLPMERYSFNFIVNTHLMLTNFNLQWCSWW